MKVRYPFRNGAQAANWKEQNCEKCDKRFCHDKAKYHCKWEREIDSAWLIRADISIECARAIGYKEAGGLYIWDCPSLVRPGDPSSKGRGAVPGQKKLFNGGTNGE